MPELTLAPRPGIGYNSSMKPRRILASALLLCLTLPTFAQDRTSPEAVKAALRKATDNLLGVVLNAVATGEKGYGYYYYQQDQEPARAREERAHAEETPRA